MRKNIKYQISKIKDTNKISKIFLSFCIAVIFLYLLFKSVSSSVFLKNKDRVNVIFYGPNTTYYSLGFGDVSYFFSIPTNLEVEILGGYGYYRVGSLGKFITLESKPDLLRKTFSSVSSSFVYLYFYPKTNAIYYNEHLERFSPGIKEIMLYGSNANPIDRLIIWFYFLGKPSTYYKKIDSLPRKKEDGKDLFDREEFFKTYQGFFYKKTHRIIKDRVQILYTKSYKTASLISNVLDGEGIQVVDVTQIPNPKSQIPNIDNKCMVIEDNKKTSVTTKDIVAFFGCQFQKGETEVSDIILMLGNIEREWEVK